MKAAGRPRSEHDVVGDEAANKQRAGCSEQFREARRAAMRRNPNGRPILQKQTHGAGAAEPSCCGPMDGEIKFGALFGASLPEIACGIRVCLVGSVRIIVGHIFVCTLAASSGEVATHEGIASASGIGRLESTIFRKWSQNSTRQVGGRRLLFLGRFHRIA